MLDFELTSGITRTYNDVGDVIELEADNYENYLKFVEQLPERFLYLTRRTPRPGDHHIRVKVYESDNLID